MNPEQEQLQRLLRAAARAPQPEAPRVLFGFATRTLAQWRNERQAGDLVATRVCWMAVLSAFCLTVAAGVFTYSGWDAKPQAVQLIEQLTSAGSQLALNSIGDPVRNLP